MFADILTKNHYKKMLMNRKFYRGAPIVNDIVLTFLGVFPVFDV